MTAADPEPSVLPPEPPLAAGDVVATVLVVFVRRLPAVLLLSLPAGLVCAVLLGLARDRLAAWPVAGPEDALLAALSGLAMAGAAAGVGLALAAGPLSVAAGEALADRRVSLRRAAGAMLVRPVGRLAVGVAIAVAALVPLAALLAADLWSFVLVPAALGLGQYAPARWGLALPLMTRGEGPLEALAHAERLSAGHRWPIACVSIVLCFAGALAGALAGAGAALAADAAAAVSAVRLGSPGLWVGAAAALAVPMIGAEVMRARLAEIREEPDLSAMMAVFE